MFWLFYTCFYAFSFLILNISGTQEIRHFDIESAPTLFIEFMQDFDKQYDSDLEKINRFQIFQQNLKKVNKLNEEQPTATFGLTVFSDWTTEEFMKLHTCKFDNTDTKRPDLDVLTVTEEKTFDWRDKGVVTEVKDQGNCGSCWAFSTIAEIECQYAIHHGQLISLSEQELVDCSGSNNGCSGGFPQDAMNDIAELGGFETEKSYPYIGKDQTCKFQRTNVVTNIQGGRAVKANETEMLSLLTQHGPLSIAIFANFEMQFYVSGILNPSYCPYKFINHAVLLVGYGPNYWIIKNSWGKQWGESGYLKLIRNQYACSIGEYIAMSEFHNKI